MNKTIPKLTEASEKLIGDALHKVADLVNGGMHPDDALVKIASAERIPAGHVRLMVRAFNNGRSIGHFKSAGSLEAKAATFDIADDTKILERMFPSSFKTAAEQHIGAAISADYYMPPASWRKRLEKAAREAIPLADAWGIEKAAEYPVQMRDRQALAKVDRLRKTVEDLNHKAVKLAYSVANTVDALRGYFKEASSLPFPQVHDNVRLVLGNRGDQLMTKLAHEHPQFTKRAGRPHNCDWSRPPYSWVKRALDLVDEFSVARTALEAAEKVAAAESQETLRPFVQRPMQSVITGSVWDYQSRIEKQAISPLGIGLGSAVGGTVGALAKELAPDTKEERIQARVADLSDLGHEQKLRAIQTQTMLQDLMMNDPVISGYDPEQVLEAYNHISQMAPRSADRRLVVQPMLRTYLEQGRTMGAFDVDQLMGVEKKLQDTGPTFTDDEAAKVSPDAKSTA